MHGLRLLCTIALIVGLIGVWSGCGAEKIPTAPWTEISTDDGHIPEVVRDAYRDDAARLALRSLSPDDKRAIEQVELPAGLVTSLYQALIRVYNIPGLAARDSVVTEYRIHTFPAPAIRYLIVEVDSLAWWVGAWRRKELVTGYPPIDSLMQEFGFEMEYYQSYPAGWANHWTRLKSRRPLNIAALATRFHGLTGILSASPRGIIGDGNDIEASVQDGGWRLDYSVGYGDCPAGCSHRRYWTFVVQSDGRVPYSGSRGAPAVDPYSPSPVNIGFSAS